MKPALWPMFSMTALGLGILLAEGAPASAQLPQSQAGGMYSGGAAAPFMETVPNRTVVSPSSSGTIIRVYPRQYTPYRGYSPAAAQFPYNGSYPTGSGPAQPFNPLKPYGPGNGAGPGYFAPPSISTYPGYDYGDYCSTDSGYGVYPTVYGDYEGVPSYFYEPGSIVFNADSTVYSDGTFYPYGYDPYNTNTLGQINTSDFTPSTDSSTDAPASLPLASDLLQSLDLIASAWKTSNSAALSQMVQPNSEIAVDLDGKYQYSIDPAAYAAMTKDAMQHLATTDFRFTGVSMGANGAVTGYAIQSYKAPNGQPANVYLAYALRKSTAASGGYTLAGVGTSQEPVLISRK